MTQQTLIDFFGSVLNSLRGISTDPVKVAQEWLIIIIVLIALAYCYQYRQRVCQALTGDPWLHCNPLDCVWCTFFRCCGLCYGDCTRLCTQCGCCRSFGLYKKNIVQEIGKALGVYTYPVELKNIVVGDLPFDSSHGDFYLQVEVGTNPAMVTSLQEDQMPKVVHFPEVLTIRVRNNLVEQRIRIVVKELNVLGHVEICDLYLTPLSVLDWMNDADPMKRFQMRPKQRDEIERETPPWICLEFSEQTEIREIEALQDWRTNSVKVRTWVPSTTFDQSMLPSSAIPDSSQIMRSHAELQQKNSETAPFLSLWGRHFDVENRNVYEQDMTTFKKAYPLMDEGGNPIDCEVEEGDLSTMENTRSCLVCIYHCVIWLVVLIIMAYCFLRFYLFSCYRQYRLLTIAGLNHTSFPVSFAKMNQLKKDCNDRFEGTGLADDGTDYCRPSPEQVYKHCEYGTQHPHAFAKIAHDWFGITDFEGEQCLGPEGICQLRNKIVGVDPNEGICQIGNAIFNCDNWVIIGCFFAVVGVCCMRWGINGCLQRKRTRLQRARALETRQIKRDVDQIHQQRAAGQTAGGLFRNAGGAMFGGGTFGKAMAGAVTRH